MENKMEISNTMYRALEAQFNSELLNAKSSMLVYFNNAVGIGEHPQHLEEMDKLIDQMATAQDKLEILHTHFGKFREDSDN
tara:strand:+ start:317 stop:559 length:243 start_codon:yes stop_codon:yes gene_type:complete